MQTILSQLGHFVVTGKEDVCIRKDGQSKLWKFIFVFCYEFFPVITAFFNF